ncbi:MAG: ATPase, T2SS/T4P/T4SS family [Desulfitobacteriaceae bacterium]|nr:ATPase, T2SS/T4P/T4SS family [Desulfitobacteriaceae bacterium]
MPIFSRTEKKEEFNLGCKPLKEVTKFVQEVITDQDSWEPDELKSNQAVLRAAMSGVPGADREAENLIKNILVKYGAEAEGLSLDEAAYEIYRYAWGLDVIEHLYRNPTVDEIRVNGPRKGQTYVSILGKNEKTDVCWEDDLHIKKVVDRMIQHDFGIALNKDTPAIESIRMDGSRVTATCPPVSRCFTMVIRKHNTFVPTLENYIARQTLCVEVYRYIEGLLKGRANILISGGTGTGKTTLLRALVGLLPKDLRIISLETDIELRLAETYPDRDIVEMEEQPKLGYDMKALFKKVLRYSPDVILVGEFRGAGEAVEAVNACTRGHDASMATAHFSSPEEAVEGTAKMMLREGLGLPLDIAMTTVASAFNVIIQMFADSTKGIKKIVRVTEIYPEGTQVKYRDLIVWRPDPNDFWQGAWLILEPPTERLQRKMKSYGMTTAKMREAGIPV